MRRGKGAPRWISIVAAELDTPHVAAAVEDQVAKLWSTKRAGREKTRQVIRAVAKQISDAVDFRKILPMPWGMLVEAFDDVLFRLLL